MRRTLVVSVGLLIAVGLVSCSGGGGTSAADMDLREVQSQLVDSGIDCKGKVGPYKAGPDDLDLGVEVSESLQCVVDGTEVEASMFSSTKDLAVALATVKAIGCGFGMGEFSYVSEGKWMLAAQLPGDDGEDDKGLLAEVAKALETGVDTISCPKDPTSADEESADATSTTLLESDDLIPVDEAERNAATKAAVGEEIDAGSGQFLVVSAIRVGGDEEPWIEVDARAENRGSETVTIPDFAVVCGGASEGEGWQADSTFPMYEEVRPGSFAEGTLNLLPTGNSRTGEAIPACDSPAVLRITLDGSTVDLAIPDDVLAAYNSAAGN